MSKTLKIKNVKIQSIKEADKDLEIYETEVFSTRQFNEIQKYLSCIRKKPIPTKTFHKDKHASTEDESAQLFDNFFIMVLTERDELELDYNNQTLNWLKVDRNRAESLLSELRLARKLVLTTLVTPS